jgi:N-acetylglutamate synthase-like GNAT family acetyltransferase
MATGGQGRSSYLLLKKDEVLGYLTVHGPEDGCLMIDEVALDKKYQGKHLGGVLLRFADTLARQSDCKFTRLYAISNQVEFYKRFGYRVLLAAPVRLQDEEFILMEHALLHVLPGAPPLPPNR